MTKLGWRFSLVTLLILLLQLQGCAVVAIGAIGASAASVANDRRTVGTQLDDQNAENRVYILWSEIAEIHEQANLDIDVYNGVALLTGQAPSQSMIDRALAEVKSVQHVKKIHNQIRIGKPVAGSTTTHDLWLASKVRAKLVASEKVPALQVNVIVADSEVFLMGKVSNQEATAAVNIARHVDGVVKVVRAFEIM